MRLGPRRNAARAEHVNRPDTPGVVIERFKRRPLPSGRSTVPADQIETDLLFELDEQLRQDVPGTDGWAGRRDWFDDELASPEFDPTGYLVATDADERPIGLIRFWHNDPIPRLGLLGVLPRHRTGLTATALLAAGLHGAFRWGSPVFWTETARPSLQRRLERAGARHTRTFAQMRNLSRSPLELKTPGA